MEAIELLLLISLNPQNGRIIPLTCESTLNPKWKFIQNADD